VSIVFTMTERADQLHHDNAPVHSAALVQAFIGKASHHPGLSAPYSPDFVLYDFWLLPKPKSPLKGRFMNAMVTQYTSSVNGVSLPTDWLHERLTIHGCKVTFPPTGCQVTSRPLDRFLSYSEWLHTFRTAIVNYVSRIAYVGL